MEVEKDKSVTIKSLRFKRGKPRQAIRLVKTSHFPLLHGKESLDEFIR